MNTKKIIVAICCIVVLSLLSGNTSHANNEIRVYLNRERLEFESPPMMVSNRTMVPMRVIFEALGAEVEWHRHSREIHVNRGEFILQIGSHEMRHKRWFSSADYGDGISYGYWYAIALDVAPMLVGNHTFVPLRAVSEAFGAAVEWDGSTNTVTITKAVTNLPTANHASFESALFSAMPDEENYMISPFSLRMALAMAANGARGITQTEILAALDINNLDAFNQAAAAFIAYSNANELVEFNIANSIWLNEDFFDCGTVDFSDTFKYIIANYFAGAAERVNARSGVDIINSWISYQTRDKINNVVCEDAFGEDSETLAMLVNAIYFKGGWASPFDPDRTNDGIFTDRNNVESSIPFMEQTGWFSYYGNDYFQMLAKPYEDNDIRMYFILPRGNGRLCFTMFENAVDNLHYSEIRLRLPRFTTEFLHDNLTEILQDMGVQLAFERFGADFSDMFTELPPGWNAFIGGILQKTFIEVNEEGTEAAAVTIIDIDAAESEPCPPIPFYLDRPFIYFIRNDATGDILFIGEFAFAE